MSIAVRNRVLIVVIITSLLSLSFAESAIAPQWTSIGGAVSWATIAGKNDVDGVTGATRVGWGAMVSGNWLVFGKHFLKVSIDVTKTHHDLTYSDSVRDVHGTRSISLLLVSVPILYMIPLGKPREGKPSIPLYSIGIGPFFGYVADKTVHEEGNLDNCSFNNFYVGPYLKAEINPFDFYKDFSLGFYLDIFRTFFIRTYDDHYYNANASAGDIGAIEIGVLVSMKKNGD